MVSLPFPKARQNSVSLTIPSDRFLFSGFFFYDVPVFFCHVFLLPSVLYIYNMYIEDL